VEAVLADTELIRPAVLADARAIAEVHIASFRSIYAGILPVAALADLDVARRAAIWSSRLSGGDGDLLVAASGAALLGFIWIGPTTDSDDDSAVIGQVRSIHVAPDQTGQGIGQVLLASGRRSLRRAGFTTATLWVVSENERARKVYVRDGWTLDGATRREPLGLPGEDMPLVTVERFRRRLGGDDGAAANRRMPKYYTVKQHLRQRIDGYPPGTPLPPERTLSEEFGAARATVRQALLELAVEGRIVRMQGRGTFVAPPKETVPLRLRSYSEEWAGRGRSPGSKLVEMRTEPAEPDVAAQLGIDLEAEVHVVERLRLIDDVPTSLEIAYLDASRFAALPELLGDGMSLYQLLNDHWGIEPDTAEQTIETVLASPQVARLLDAEAGTPVLLLTRTTSDLSGAAFEFVRSVYRGDRFRFSATLPRQ
jgi:GntR family transcriptional regulator